MADYLAEVVDDRIDRRVRNGAKDRGDLSGVRMSPALRSQRVVCELKDTTRCDLPGWTREAATERMNDDAAVGLVIHKRHGNANPAEQWVSMTVADLVALLTGERPEGADE
ncbi:hypothetical protein BJF85_16685 [Saccharomonospora sp. CUA-673]|nr:hypothetical protein BJF85_16685 [Saccharomonospora sp. CUA-673]